MRILTDFEEKSHPVVKSESPLAKLQESCLKNSKKSEKVRGSRKVTLAVKDERSERECISHSNIPKNLSKSNKSNRSIKSIGSNHSRSQSKSRKKEPKIENISKI